MKSWYWPLVAMISVAIGITAIATKTPFVLLGLLLFLVVAYAYHIERQRARRLAAVLKQLEKIERLTRPRS